MMANNVLDLAEALVTIYNADATVQTITGRSEFNLVPRGAQKFDDVLPVATWFVVASIPFRGTAGHTRTVIQFEVWASMQTHNLETLHDLLNRALDIFTAVNLDAQGIDAAVEATPNVRDGLLEDEDGVRSLATDFTFDLTVN